jgi:glycerol-3-phosphate dehydrogenase (NAD(P)+)
VPAKKKIAVVGGGAWGTALAAHAARLEHDVILWAREPEGVALPRSLRASADPSEVLAGADIVILVPPSAFLRNVAGVVAEHVPRSARIVIATKGIEEKTLHLMTDVAAEVLTGHDANELCALSGPSFAREVASGLPTDVVVASKSSDAATAGACDGLGMGTNARAALVTRGLSEMARLGVALGGDPLTFMGLSGVGDLILTSTGALSRNRSLGIKVAEGIEAGKYLASQRTVAEGFLTARAAWRLAQKLGVDVPITEQVYYVLHEDRPLLEAMKMLLTRAQKDELWGLG